jgi:chromosome partitioning protein
MRTIAVIARKGGSGKTTVAVHLAIAAHLRGKRTLLADSDPQRSSSAVLSGRAACGPGFRETSGPELFSLQASAVRAGVEAFFIDTPAGAEDELAHAIVLADLSLLVIRPTFLDFAAAIRTAEVLRRLRKPGLIVLNQAPVPRAGAEPPLVKKAQAALRIMRLPVAPTILRARAAYQAALESGRSAEELTGAEQAADEVAALWTYVDHLAFGARTDMRSQEDRLRA